MEINYPLLLDGGLSNVLNAQGCDLNNQLWSAKILDTNPQAIIQAHMAYLEAGAQCITTASYQATIPGFLKSGFDLEKSQSLIKNSVTLAEESIQRFKTLNDRLDKYFIAASIGPYGAYLADGSEYHGNYGISDQQLIDFHLPRIKLLDETNADFLAFETIPSYQEGRIIADLLTNTKKSAWVSFSCKDEFNLNDGTPIQDIAAILANHPNIFAMGVNCTAPKFITGLIKHIKPVCKSKKIVVYPNSGEIYDARNKTWVGLADPEIFVNMAKEWMLLGADIIGGCCRIGPQQINQLSKTMDNINPKY